MGYRDKRNEWLREVEQRRRDIVFPQFSKDEISLWRTLKQRPLNLPAKIAFIWFVVSMVGFAVFVLVQSHREGELRDLAVTTGLTIVLFIAPIFALIAWSVHRSLREIRDLNRNRKIRPHRY